MNANEPTSGFDGFVWPNWGARARYHPLIWPRLKVKVFAQRVQRVERAGRDSFVKLRRLERKRLNREWPANLPIGRHLTC